MMREGGDEAQEEEEEGEKVYHIIFSLDIKRIHTRTKTSQMWTYWLFVLYLHPSPCYNILQYSPNRAPHLNSLICLLRYINIEVLSLRVSVVELRSLCVSVSLGCG
jgi:hypothetical protein